MDSFDKISISKLATIISNNTIIRTTNNSTWNKILSNAGYSELFKKYEQILTPYSYNRGFTNENPRFSELFTAVNHILLSVYNNGENSTKFIDLINSIIDEITLNNLFETSLENVNDKRIARYYDTFEQWIKDEDTDDELANTIINRYASSEYQGFIHNLSVLNLHLEYKHKRFILNYYNNKNEEQPRNPGVIMQWLRKDFNNIAKSYEEAIENFLSGNAVSCISSCRNILTGLFTQFKNDGDAKWFKGLQNLSTDTYIENVVAPNNIMQGSANNKFSLDPDSKNFNFPRYKLIFTLYSLTSDLGAHINESPKIGGATFPESATMNDALLCLRLTEDVLVWVKERLKTYPSI